jgi:hypothetical protein
VRSAVVRVGRKPAKRTRRSALRISLVGLPAGRIRIRIALQLSNGRSAVRIRGYRTCARPGR